MRIPLFATYVAGENEPLHRLGHKTVSYGPARRRIAALAADQALAHAEVRVQFPDGSERLYAVLVHDGALLHLKDVDGGDIVVQAHTH